MKLTRRVGFLALAQLMTLVLVSQAFADVKVVIGAGGTTAKSHMKFKIEGVQNPPPCGPFLNEDLWGPGDGSNEHFCLGPVNPADNKAVGRAIYFGPGTSSATASWCYGDAEAGGGNQTSSAPDTAYASVGLYKAGGGTNLGADQDSLLRVNITRTAGNVAVVFPQVGGASGAGSGGLQVRAVGGSQTTIAEFRLIVYPTQAAADADVNTDGTGSAYFGRIKLETGAGVPSALVPVAGFAPGDFTFIDEGGGKYTARPIPNLTKNVAVANSATAVVVLYADPRSVDRPVSVPSNTPFGLALLALALMASGVWAISARRRAQAA